MIGRDRKREGERDRERERHIDINGEWEQEKNGHIIFQFYMHLYFLKENGNRLKYGKVKIFAWTMFYLVKSLSR